MDYLQYSFNEETYKELLQVLNLIINGLPSILSGNSFKNGISGCFKPYYKWITFNTVLSWVRWSVFPYVVLNLIINGLPSILGLKAAILGAGLLLF